MKHLVTLVLVALTAAFFSACGDSTANQYPEDSVEWLLENMTEARGGREALNAVESITFRHTGTDFHDNYWNNSKAVIYFDRSGRAYESRFATDMDGDFEYSHSRTITASESWTSHRSGTQKTEFRTVKDEDKQKSSDYFEFWFNFPQNIHAVSEKFQLKREPDTIENGSEKHVLIVTPKNDSEEIYKRRFTIDSESFLIDNVEIQYDSEFSVLQIYDDYKTVSGVKYHMSVFSKTYLDVEYNNHSTSNTQDININTPPDPDWFEIPAEIQAKLDEEASE